MTFPVPYREWSNIRWRENLTETARKAYQIYDVFAAEDLRHRCYRIYWRGVEIFSLPRPLSYRDKTYHENIEKMRLHGRAIRIGWYEKKGAKIKQQISDEVYEREKHAQQVNEDFERDTVNDERHWRRWATSTVIEKKPEPEVTDGNTVRLENPAPRSD